MPAPDLAIKFDSSLITKIISMKSAVMIPTMGLKLNDN
jgi:hypothetical protein